MRWATWVLVIGLLCTTVACFSSEPNQTDPPVGNLSIGEWDAMDPPMRTAVLEGILVGFGAFGLRCPVPEVVKWMEPGLRRLKHVTPDSAKVSTWVLGVLVGGKCWFNQEQFDTTLERIRSRVHQIETT